MIKIYRLGRGGKHRANADARAWREFTTHIAHNFRAAHPNLVPGIERLHAEILAEHTAILYNARLRNEMGMY